MTKRKRKRKLSKKARQELVLSVIILVGIAILLAVDKLGTDGPAVKSKSSAKVGDTSVHFVDVGQGDSTLIMSGDSVMLIDTGDRDENNYIEGYLENQGIERIDYFVITHPHADHMGEAAEIISQFDIGTVVIPRLPDDMIPTTAVYERMLDAMDEKGLKFHAGKDESFQLGSCTVDIFAPHEDYSNLNNYSLIVKLTHGENTFLITGDCEKQEEKEFLQRGCDIDADVLKAAHHGSDTSSTQEWIDEVSPMYAVISCGVDNRYGHPHDETVRRLENAAEKVYITAEDGSIVFLSDGKGLTIKVEKENKR